MNLLFKEIEDRISPPIKVTLDLQKYKNKEIIRILVPRGDESPYSLDENQIFIRDESETNLAVRDEIVTLVERHLHILPNRNVDQQPTQTVEKISKQEPSSTDAINASLDPRTGVEIIASINRGGKTFYTMRDLRNGNIVKNVTQASARRLWHYAISRYKEIPSSVESSEVQWKGNYGLLRQYAQGQIQHYDFVYNTGSGFRYFFGVTPDGINGEWKIFVANEDE
jgi:hypothetical protein